MSHQPFEDWILDPVTISPEERRALREHLEGCQQCQRMERKWQAVHQQLRAPWLAAPAPGFTHRWQASLAERREREQRKQAWKIFGFLMGGAVFILLLLAGYIIATSSPAEWLVGVVNVFSSSQKIIDLAVFAVQSWLSTTPLALNIALWIYLTITLCVLTIVWAMILWRTKSAGVVNA